MELKNRTAIITGSTGQLGSSIAVELTGMGCNCVCHYFQNEKRARELQDQIANIGSGCCILQADLSDAKQIKNFIRKAFEFECCTILINSAALFYRQRLSEVNSQEAMKIMSINFLAPVLMSQQFVEHLTNGSDKNRVANIVNISDVAGVMPWADYSVYCGSKAALIAATKSLAKELGPNIRVNSVAPGIVNWPVQSGEDEKEKQLGRIPLKRTATAKEVAHAVIALIENDYITGQVLCVDGGRSL